MVSKEKGNSNKSIAGGKHLLNSRTRPFYFRRCKRARATNIESLPDELLSSILVRLPADYLHHVARLVCRRWSNIIRSDAFVNEQIQHSTYGLLFSCNRSEGSHHPILVTATQGGRVEVSEFNYKCKSRSKTSCDGLVLREERILYHPTIYISNPATKQSFILPLITTGCEGFSGIAFAAPSNKYKVTVPYWRSCGDLRLAILTFGVDDSWRNVGVEHLTSRHDKIALHRTPLISEGFMHWANYGHDSILTLDVETEKLTMSEVPLYFKVFKQLLYLSTGRFLSALVGHRDLSWEVWGMKSETGEWKKVLADIDLRSQKRKLQQLDSRGGKGELVAIGWVNYPEVLALAYHCDSRNCLFYNLDTHEINSTPVPYLTNFLKAFVHKNTLLRLS